MREDWAREPLGELLKRVARFEERDDFKEYQFAGTYSFARGIFVGERKLGSTFKLSKVQRIHEVDFVYCKIMAWEGAFGLVPKEAHNCVMSGAFVAYEVDREQIDPSYLGYYFKVPSVWQSIGRQSTGTNVRRRSLHPKQFEAATIPLPPLSEQRRIVARIEEEELAAKVEEAQGLRQQVTEVELPSLSRTIFRRVFEGKVLTQDSAEEESPKELIAKMKALKARLIAEKKIKKEKPLTPILESDHSYQLPERWEWVRLSDICAVITDGTHQTPKYVDEGMMFLSAQNVKPYRFMPENCRYVSHEDYLSYVAHVKPHKGDVLMTRVGAKIGEATIVDRELDFAIYVSLCLIRPFKEYVHTPYLLHWLNSPYGAASAKENTLGRGHSQGNLNLNLIRQFVLPFPPVNEQRRIAAYLDNLQAKVDALKGLQAETAAELDALLPSILDKAFKGEL